MKITRKYLKCGNSEENSAKLVMLLGETVEIKTFSDFIGFILKFDESLDYFYNKKFKIRLSSN